MAVGVATARNLRKTQGATSAQVEFDALSGLKRFQSGFWLLLLDSVPLSGEVRIMESQFTSGELVEQESA
jgi:hypothetical protein